MLHTAGHHDIRHAKLSCQRNTIDRLNDITLSCDAIGLGLPSGDDLYYLVTRIDVNPKPVGTTTQRIREQHMCARDERLATGACMHAHAAGAPLTDNRGV